MLYYLVSQMLLPASYEGIPLGGRSVTVVLFDLGSNMSVVRLKTLMIKEVSSRSGRMSEPLPIETITALIRSALEHLHVFRPQSSRSLLVTLSSLQSYIFDTTSHVSANRTLGAIFVNDIDAFLWQDRLEDAEDQTIDPTTLQTSRLLPNRFRELVNDLRRLQRDFSCLVVATSSALSPMTFTRVDGLSVPLLQSHLPSAWRSFVTARIIVQRDAVRKFQHGMSVEEAAREAGQRRDAVENSAFSARLDWSESEAWREDTRNAIRALDGTAALTFKITADGVDLNVDD